MAILPEERRKKMLELLNENGSVTIEELARRFGVSEMTIRRDLDKYRRVGQVKRCRGGAVLRGDNVGEVEYQKKISTNLETKQRIAAYCAGLVTEGMQVFLDAGTTVFYIARELLAVPGVTFLTNDLKTALFLSRHRREVILLGGHVQNSTGSAVGALTMEMVGRFRDDIAFVGTSCIDDAFDALTPTVDKAFFKRAIRQNAKDCFLVADSSKFHRSALVRINSLADYTAVVTDYRFTEEEKRLAEDKRIEIISV